MTFTLTPQFRRRLDDEVAWLTTVTRSGRPAPRPVWFVFDGEAFVVFSEPGAAKVRHLARQSRVTVHFNSDAGGGDVLVVHGSGELDPDLLPSRAPGYLDKYEPSYPVIGHDRDSFDATYSTAIRITPDRAWGFE
ncbi:TIGR03667 family PPOX class F420-dependent oxidoreductase [Saccharomonospora saliphila]|uniref:TIGR03667 family PPOX class F420-dependent oxidoreductase n=1 Tax=Saccharomonospora saliphila TaxID=369829 RepID=UPI00036CB3D2|nr:TIGR03667 family PPOX class F420-dependent oxidoreductase [Saccharomonospora saliphila]